MHRILAQPIGTACRCDGKEALPWTSPVLLVQIGRLLLPLKLGVNPLIAFIRGLREAPGMVHLEISSQASRRGQGGVSWIEGDPRPFGRVVQTSTSKHRVNNN